MLEFFRHPAPELWAHNPVEISVQSNHERKWATITDLFVYILYSLYIPFVYIL